MLYCVADDDHGGHNNNNSNRNTNSDNNLNTLNMVWEWNAFSSEWLLCWMRRMGWLSRSYGDGELVAVCGVWMLTLPGACSLFVFIPHPSLKDLTESFSGNERPVLFVVPAVAFHVVYLFFCVHVKYHMNIMVICIWWCCLVLQEIVSLQLYLICLVIDLLYSITFEWHTALCNLKSRSCVVLLHFFLPCNLYYLLPSLMPCPN